MAKNNNLPLGVIFTGILGVFLGLIVSFLPNYLCFGNCPRFDITSILFYSFGLLLICFSIALFFRKSWSRIFLAASVGLVALGPLISAFAQLIVSQDFREFAIFLIISLVIFLIPIYLLFNKKVREAFK